MLDERSGKPVYVYQSFDVVPHKFCHMRALSHAHVRCTSTLPVDLIYFTKCGHQMRINTQRRTIHFLVIIRRSCSRFARIERRTRIKRLWYHATQTYSARRNSIWVLL